MPVYDCGAQDCEECQRAFGPDRTKAIAEYEARARAYAEPSAQKMAITIWKTAHGNAAGWKLWSAHDAHYAEGEPDWFMTIQLSEILNYLEAAPSDRHDSGCATHNMPAMPNGPCDCSLSRVPSAEGKS